jgi:hypothetical protein
VQHFRISLSGKRFQPAIEWLQDAWTHDSILIRRQVLPHIYGHDVREDEAIDVLNDAGEDRAGQDGARIAAGQTAAGRYLRVIYVPDGELDRVFVITAYDLVGKPPVAYRRRRRKKQQ